MQELAGLAEAEAPRAGMFLWLRLADVDDSASLKDLFKLEKVVVVPGTAPVSHLSHALYRMTRTSRTLPQTAALLMAR